MTHEDMGSRARGKCPKCSKVGQGKVGFRCNCADLVAFAEQEVERVKNETENHYMDALLKSEDEVAALRARVLELQNMDTKDAQENASLRVDLQKANALIACHEYGDELVAERESTLREALRSHACPNDGSTDTVCYPNNHKCPARRLSE